MPYPWKGSNAMKESIIRGRQSFPAIFADIVTIMLGDGKKVGGVFVWW
jgi:hypothetical protein